MNEKSQFYKSIILSLLTIEKKIELIVLNLQIFNLCSLQFDYVIALFFLNECFTNDPQTINI